MDPVVIDNLTKDYGVTRALDGTSWSLRRGALLGFLGPNGAGKSTTLRILLGFLKASAGRATVLGMDAWRDAPEIHRRVGYLSGDVRLYPHLNGMQTIRFVAGVRAMHDTSEGLRLADVLEFDLHKRVREYSRGMRQKLGLIIALMHRPELLVLDEPTAGLDPLMQHALYGELRAAAAEGRTVLFSSHSLSEVAALCQSVVLLRAGRVVASKSVADIRSEAGQRIKAKLATRLTEPGAQDTGLANPPEGFTIDKCDNGELEGRWRGRPEIVLSWLATLPVTEISIEPAGLEDVFLDYYRPESNDA